MTITFPYIGITNFTDFCIRILVSPHGTGSVFLVWNQKGLESKVKVRGRGEEARMACLGEEALHKRFLVLLHLCSHPPVCQLPASEWAEEWEMPTSGVRDWVHAEIISSDRFITLGLMPALLQLGELTQLQSLRNEDWVTGTGKTMLRWLERDWSQDEQEGNCAKESWRVSSRQIVSHCVILRKLNIMEFRLSVSQSSQKPCLWQGGTQHLYLQRSTGWRNKHWVWEGGIQLVCWSWYWQAVWLWINCHLNFSITP